MKGLARSFVFWPGIDADIEANVKACTDCGKHAHAPPEYRPVAGVMMLIIVDAYSKWLEVKVTSSTTSHATIRILDKLFAAYGVPITVVSDNGTQFTSAEFKKFLQSRGVKYHKLTAPYHPATNGQAQRYVQTVKDALKAIATTKDTLQQNLNEFLRQYRKAPYTTTGQPPSQLFLGRNLRTRLDLVRPGKNTVAKTDRPQRQLSSYIPGVIAVRLGDLHYEIEYNGRRFKRHVDQLRSRQEEQKTKRQPGSTEMTSQNAKDQDRSRRIRYHGAIGETAATQPVTAPVAPPVNVPAQTTPPPAPTSAPTPRHSQRPRRPPDRYTPS
ncbi:PREDICTED: uncharacterized protein K02A2.6-like [Wasmannia auropunctata]|uniref:uncharacterized protein K02A2.6-like n=1 Tax=Wasmannia auropunctata TaxID=64793 RepID=UPI0005EE0D35|nr:PREDICTED: uncharacterized protein K02A2.6-like [Wasmannia auropunctata]